MRDIHDTTTTTAAAPPPPPSLPNLSQLVFNGHKLRPRQRKRRLQCSVPSRDAFLLPLAASHFVCALLLSAFVSTVFERLYTISVLQMVPGCIFLSCSCRGMAPSVLTLRRLSRCLHDGRCSAYDNDMTMIIRFLSLFHLFYTKTYPSDMLYPMR